MASATELFLRGQSFFTGDSFASVPRDYMKAADLFQQAADQGNRDAQYYLAICYEKGLGVHQDHDKSMQMLHLSAAQRNEDALVDLGLLYFEGDGVNKDMLKAYRLWTAAVPNMTAMCCLDIYNERFKAAARDACNRNA
jgi:TPR repeat protein